MKFSSVVFDQIFPKALPGAYSALESAAERFGIEAREEVCVWLGQMALESDEFRTTRESLNYTPQGLIATFGTKRITPEQAARVGRLETFVGGKKQVTRHADQEAAANILYGGAWGLKNLGNTQPGDGWLTIGRGFKQLTGRSNYERAGLGIHKNRTIYIRDPISLEKPKDAALSAAWFWIDNALGERLRAGGVKAVTMKITGWTGQGDGSNVSFARRVEYTKRLMEATT